MLIKNINDLKNFLEELEENKNFISNFKTIVKTLKKSLEKKSKILICGNGGSHAEAQHFTAELMVRLKKKNNRKPLACITLGSEISTLSAHSNDYGFDTIFSRQVEALAKRNDVLLVLSTSGSSLNIIKALEMAKKMKIKSIGLLGGNGGKASKLCDKSIVINKFDTARVQEIHLLLLHSIAEAIEMK